MSRKIYLVIAVIIIGFSGPVSAQVLETPPISINYIPPSPTAAALGRYGEVPVSHYTGVPDISVPLYTIKNKNLTLPITLSYHAGGLKVSENASWVGLGWSLQAGGVITRTVRSLPDELDNGYKQGYNLVWPMIQAYKSGAYNDTQKAQFLANLADGQLDGEPDEYFFNFAGKSGRIIFDGTNDPVIVPYQQLKVEISPNGIGSGFTITDEGGIKYHFASIELTENIDACDLVPIGTFVSTWYLSSITAPGGEKIDFTYNGGITYLDVIPSESKYQLISPGGSGCTGMNITECKKVYKIYTNRLSKISWSGNSIDFMSNTKRTDLLSPSDEYRLDEVRISNGALQRKFVLSYGAFGAGKLMLNSFQEHPGSGQDQIKPYVFQYFQPEQVPPVTSKAQDHWGFYNMNSVSSLVPTGIYFTQLGTKVTLYGADRSPSSARTQIGVLSEITYPTGGSTKFGYELNEYGYIRSQQMQDYVKEPRSVFAQATPSNTYSSEQFNIEFIQDVQISYGVNITADGSQYPNTNEYVTITKVGSSQPFFSRIQGTGNLQTELGPGTYTIVANSESPLTVTTISVAYRVNTDEVIKKFPTGGLRIAKLTTRDGLNQSNDVITEYKYTMEGESDRSSGVTMGDPIYDYYYRKAGQFGNECQYYVRTAIGNTLGSTKGSHVGYREVAVNRSDGASSRYSFTSFYEHWDPLSFGYPFPVPSSVDYLRGLPIAITHYKKVGNENIKVQHTRNRYVTRAENQKQSEGLKVGYILKASNLLLTTFSIQSTVNYSQWLYLDSVYNYSYGPNGIDAVLTITKNFHDNPVHIQPTRMEVTKSDGSKEVTLTTYPDDYASGTAFLDNMKTNHLIAYPIEQVRYKEVGTARTILSGTITKYLTGGKGLVDQVLELETPTPLALSAFKFSNRAAGQLPPTGGATAFAAHAAYAVRLTYGNYDAFGNPQQISPAFGAPTAYIWSYGGQYPVAEIKNAGFATVQTAMGGAATLTTFTASSPAEADLRSKFNGIRASLPNSSLTYYTYKPLIGMASSTDPTGRTTYYEYDGFGRLKAAKDTQQKTKETFDYNYRNQ